MSPATSMGKRRRTTEQVADPTHGSGSTPVGVDPIEMVWRALALERLASATGSLALVTAPAGYGKTSHVRAWSRQDGRPVAWVDLDRSHNDPGTFLAGVLGELAAVVDLGHDELLEHASDDDDEIVLGSRLGKLVRSCAVPFILVLDNAHVLQRPPVTTYVRILAESVPGASTVVIVGRSTGHLELSRVRAYSKAVELRMSDLALDTGAARSLLRGLGISADDTQVAAVVAHTEGWPLGIRLTMLGTQLSAEGDAVIDASLWGRSDAVGTFVMEEWLTGLPDETSDFLLRTSCLDRLSGAVCDALLDRADSAHVLDGLHHEMQGLISLDRDGAYHVHPLLRDVLGVVLGRTDRAEQQRLQLVASGWCESAGDIDGAITQALAAGDVSRASHLVVRFAPTNLTAAQVAVVDRWISVLGRDVVLASAELSLVAALNAFVQGDLVGGGVLLRMASDRAAQHPDGESVEPQIAAIASLTTTAVDESTREQAKFAYDQCPPGVWRTLACFSYGLVSVVFGDETTAMSVLTEGSAEARVFGTPSLEAQCSAATAFVLATTGAWSEAEPLARSARRVQRQHALDDRPTLAIVTAMSALIEARHGDTEAARSDAVLARRGIANLSAGGGRPGLLARIALVEADLALGDTDAASTLVDEASRLAGSIAGIGRLADHIEELGNRARRGAGALPYGPSALTTAELRVLHYLPTNLTLAKIAELHFISRNTAKSHAAAVYRKLGVNSRSEAVDLARTVGLLPGDGTVVTDDRHTVEGSV